MWVASDHAFPKLSGAPSDSQTCPSFHAVNIPWQPPFEIPRLASDEVHVWRINLAVADEADAPECLSDDELARAQRFRFVTERRRFLNRRVRLRQGLARYLNCAPRVLRFGANAFGKPTLANEPSLRFSFSHSADLALLAVAREREVGVDVELQRPLPEARRMAQSFFAPDELAALASLPEDAFVPGFFECWSRKEAFVKALGLGLSFPLDSFVVSVGQPAELLEVHGLPPPPASWTLLDLEVGAGFSAALAVEGANVTVRCWGDAEPEAFSAMAAA